MRYDQTTRRFRATATDLANHARCEHLTQRAREHAVAVAEGRAERIERGGLAVEKGRAFESAYVAKRRALVEQAGGRFVDCSEAGDDREAQRRVLRQALRDGVELIAQAPMRSGELVGTADLLVRVADGDEAGGALGIVHRYEPVEIKYGRSVRPAYVMQASAYADALEHLQGALPARMYVVTGDEREHELATADYVEYYRAARARFLEAITGDLDAALEPVPDPVPHCVGCDFEATCRARWTELDHLSLVANIRADQRAKLQAVGIDTLAQLATTDLDRVPGIGSSTFPRLRTQARLQLESRDGDPADTAIEFRTPGPGDPPGRGFAMLPEPDAHDIFFDFEGYPYHERGALEYLWGWTSRDAATGELRFDHFWADTPAEEGVAFTRFLDEVERRRTESGGRMHVFHYAPYEITALRRLAKEHPHEQFRLDAMLRAGVFVDLYAVVRQSLQVGLPSYSIKYIEPLYGVSRAGDELADGGASIEVYEQYLNERDERVRATIIDYNRVDCDSTLLLRDWLLDRRDDAAAAGITWPAPELPGAEAEGDGEASDEESTEDERAPTTRERLEAIAADEARADDVRAAARLLASMPGWDRRVKREFFGDLYGRMHERHPEDDLRDPNVLSMLELVEVDEAPHRAGAGTVDRTYRYPDQAHLVEVGHDAIDPSVVVTVGSVRAVDADGCLVTIRTTKGDADKLVAKGLPRDWRPRSVIGWKDISTRDLEATALDVGQRFADALDAGADPFAQDAPHAAALSMLAGHATRVSHGAGPEALEGTVEVAALADLVRRAEGSSVIVQGPPGTGKTYTSVRLIAELVASGLTVGISSNSHAAAINVLRGIQRYRDELAAEGAALDLRAAYALRTKEKAPGTFGFGDDWIERPKNTKAAAQLLADGEVQVIAGTAWQLRACADLDVLLVDEAGQVSLLHLTAMAACAKRVVLVGDPQQLPQPTSASHPHGCGASALEHLFRGEAVLPHDRAVLLPVTYRMHPQITSFVSDAYYRGELRADAQTVHHRVLAPGAGVPQSGTHLLEVDHHGNRSQSPEEVEAIRELVARLLDGGRVVAKASEAERELRPSDIIVVAPYNAQRRALQVALGADIAVGTVDKFQGQEAAVAIVSMTASSRYDLPRGLEFLLDPHRVNVAISRARALTVLVASPALLATEATSIDEMSMLNDLARYARASSRSSSSSRRS